MGNREISEGDTRCTARVLAVLLNLALDILFPDAISSLSV